MSAPSGACRATRLVEKLRARLRLPHRRLRASSELQRHPAGVSFRPVPLLGPISVWFTEDVNGITPSSVLVRRLIGYTVMLNPEFVLDVTDLAGNPFRREELYVQTAPPG